MKKNPILVVRTPEDINKEYTDVIIQIGQCEVDLCGLQKRKEQIIDAQEQLLGKVTEPAEEMNLSQKEIRRKEEKEKAEKPEEPKEIVNESAAV